MTRHICMKDGRIGSVFPIVGTLSCSVSHKWSELFSADTEDPRWRFLLSGPRQHFRQNVQLLLGGRRCWPQSVASDMPLYRRMSGICLIGLPSLRGGRAVPLEWISARKRGEQRIGTGARRER